MADPLMNPALREFWAARGYHIKSLYGGRASSKTWDAAGAAVMMALHSKGRFLCTREFQNRIDDSVYDVLCKTIERFNVGYWFDVQRAAIECRRTGTDFLFYGRARNFEQIKGTEGVTVHWAEECEMLTKPQHDAIDGTISRNQGAQHWMIFNPRYATDFVYKLVTSGEPDILARRINYDENPFLAQTMLDVIAKAKRIDYDEYLNLYEGVPLSDDDAVVIKREWIEAAIDAHLTLGVPVLGGTRIGYDIADSGKDKCATIERHGGLATRCEEWKAGEHELDQSAARVFDRAQEVGAQIVYDCIGVGAGTGATIIRLNEELGQNVPFTAWNAGAGVIDPKEEYRPGKTNADHFANLKAQAWGNVADMFRATYAAVRHGSEIEPDMIISISSQIENKERLITELSTPRKDLDRHLRFMVESKKDLAARNIASPNLADAFIMAYAPTETEYWGI